MLVFPGPPVSLLSKPLDQPGEYAIPTRGEKSLSGVGAMVEGTPGSPGET
jgi:hypothetical protein